MKLSKFSSGVPSITRFRLSVSWHNITVFLRQILSQNSLQTLTNLFSIVWGSVGKKT